MPPEFIDVPSNIAQAYRRATHEQRRRAQEALASALDASSPSSDTSPISAYDLIKDVVGSIEGPGDMSHNPDYLDDLGASSLR